jgi:hemoglobin
MTDTVTAETTFERIGGIVVIDRLVDSFYERMSTWPEARAIRAMHAGDLTSIKSVLKRYLTEWTGGPKLYSVEKGHPRLRQRHLGFSIGDTERDAWLLCMRGALASVIEDTQVRGELDTALTKLADWMRNQAGNPHDIGSGRP